MCQESKTFPPLIWEELTFKQRAVWPFPVVCGERIEASKALLGTHNKPLKRIDTLQDFEVATW